MATSFDTLHHKGKRTHLSLVFFFLLWTELLELWCNSEPSTWLGMTNVVILICTLSSVYWWSQITAPHCCPRCDLTYKTNTRNISKDLQYHVQNSHCSKKKCPYLDATLNFTHLWLGLGNSNFGLYSLNFPLDDHRSQPQGCVQVLYIGAWSKLTKYREESVCKMPSQFSFCDIICQSGKFKMESVWFLMSYNSNMPEMQSEK